MMFEIFFYIDHFICFLSCMLSRMNIKITFPFYFIITYLTFISTDFTSCIRRFHSSKTFWIFLNKLVDAKYSKSSANTCVALLNPLKTTNQVWIVECSKSKVLWKSKTMIVIYSYIIDIVIYSVFSVPYELPQHVS